ncbi:hypothetical protein Taro_035094 [Colocasia esculenta]|uniref:AAA+ ATPase domain-containing protein n=1 Tax=Colocasia esculenta TaxID=4460 RepID=A0A843W9I3_COLES|nr:hypothetical protein [Colocasia esculenta]
MASAAKAFPPSASSALSAAASLAATAVLVRTVFRDLLPDSLRDYLSSLATSLAARLSPEVTAVVEELDGLRVEPLYRAAEAHLASLVSPSVRRLRVSRRHPLDGAPNAAGGLLLLTVGRGEEVVDVFDGAWFRWRSESSREIRPDRSRHADSKHLPKLPAYLSSVEGRLAAEQAAGRGPNIHIARYESRYENVADVWRPADFRHPATFDTMAMDPGLKRAVVEDLTRFTQRREYYSRVGRPWKRGYLLHGPPGTGKSSLVAAMANFLHYDIYDLELTELSCNSELRKLLVATSGRSILVVEDIDCTVEVSRDDSRSRPAHNRLRLDPAMLRPGRMDMHIHLGLGYCSPQAFDVLANNYHRVKDHPLFRVIKALLGEVEATPAEIAEELMREEDTDKALSGVIELLERKKQQAEHSTAKRGVI